MSRASLARDGRNRDRRLRCALMLAALVPGAGVADSFALPPTDVDLVGRTLWARTTEGDTLLDIARLYDVGQEEILAANPRVDRWLPAPGTPVLIPSRHILPNVDHKGIVLNLPEMRLYYFRPDTDPPRVTTYPVSVGRMDWTTPLGSTRIISKQKDPSWTPPDTVKAEHAAGGDPLPAVVPPGPSNPLGRFALRLGIPGYLLHGTNKPYGVGMRVTHGCIRLYPEDIEELFKWVPVGTPVLLVNQPIKLGWLGELLYIEVHAPLEEDAVSDRQLMRMAVDRIYERLAERDTAIDGAQLSLAVRQKTGMPVLLSRTAPAAAGMEPSPTAQ